MAKKEENEKNLENRLALLPKLYRVWKTLIQMLQDRGYIITEDCNFSTYNEWEKEYQKKSISHLFYKKKEENEVEPKRLYFQYIESVKVNGKDIENFIARMVDGKACAGIIVVSSPLTSQAKQKIIETDTVLQLQCFNISELMVNITQHSYVPKHVLLSEIDKNTLLKRYRIKENQLPKILTTDPIAKYLGLRKGNVVKIIRDSETAGKYVTYRITV